MVGLDDIDDHLDKRDRREKLAAVVGLEIGEPGEEVLIDAPENVAVGVFRAGSLNTRSRSAQHLIVEFLIFVLRERGLQRIVVILDRLHRIDDRLCAIRTFRKRSQVIELRLFAQKNRALPEKSSFCNSGFLPPRVGNPASISDFTRKKRL